MDGKEVILNTLKLAACLMLCFFADMLDGRGMKRLVSVPIPFCYHCVTMSPSLVLVICFLFSVLVSYFDPPAILFCRLILTDTVQAPSQDACYVFE